MKRRAANVEQAALDILRRLRAGGHIAYFAGGCVRDRLLGRIPKDIDVATDAVPARVLELFSAARPVGARFGVVLVRRFGHDVEVATFRADGVYSDGRRPDDVTFGTEIDDAQRRDFTINGMFYDPVEDRIIDHVGGTEDIQCKVIRTIGDPRARFAEDHLRMLRAVRFAAALDFDIVPATMAAIQDHAMRLRLISPERIWMELVRILTPPSRVRGWRLLRETGLRPCLCETWRADDRLDDDALRRLAALDAADVSAPLGLSACLVGQSPQQAADVARELRLSNHMQDDVVFLLESLPRALQPDALETADLKLLMHRSAFEDLLRLVRAELKTAARAEEPYERLVRRAALIAPEAVAPPPLLTGYDLQSLGVPAGRRLGDIHRCVYRAQLNELISTKEQAVALAQSLMAEIP